MSSAWRPCVIAITRPSEPASGSADRVLRALHQGNFDRERGSAAQAFEQRSGASFREIIDLADFDNSLAINVPGQSAQPGSPHYGDQLPLWGSDRYFPLVYSRAAVERETRNVLMLMPTR